MITWAFAGGGKSPFSSQKIGIKNQIFLENRWSRHLKFRLIDLILAMTVFLPVWNLHSTRARFTVIVSCSDGLAVHSCLFLCLQRRVAKVANGLFCCWSLLRNNTVATNPLRFTFYYGSRRFVVWDCWTHTSW